jgi:hypothetical protein
MREIVLAMGSIVCPATRAAAVDLREHGHECQLFRCQAVAVRSIHPHRAGHGPIFWRDQAISTWHATAKYIAVGGEVGDGRGETARDNIGCVDLVSHRPGVITQPTVENAVGIGERHNRSGTAPRRSWSWALKALRIR